MLQCARGVGELFRGVWLLLLTFPPSPFLGACVTACDTLPREHGCRGNVYTRYTFVTCHESDTLFPGWVFLAQVWAGSGFCPRPPRCLVNRIDLVSLKNKTISRDLGPRKNTEECVNLRRGLIPRALGRGLKNLYLPGILTTGRPAVAELSLCRVCLQGLPDLFLSRLAFGNLLNQCLELKNIFSVLHLSQKPVLFYNRDNTNETYLNFPPCFLRVQMCVCICI